MKNEKVINYFNSYFQFFIIIFLKQMINVCPKITSIRSLIAKHAQNFEYYFFDKKY